MLKGRDAAQRVDADCLSEEERHSVSRSGPFSDLSLAQTIVTMPDTIVIGEDLVPIVE